MGVKRRGGRTEIEPERAGERREVRHRRWWRQSRQIRPRETGLALAMLRRSAVVMPAFGIRRAGGNCAQAQVRIHPDGHGSEREARKDYLEKEDVGESPTGKTRRDPARGPFGRASRECVDAPASSHVPLPPQEYHSSRECVTAEWAADPAEGSRDARSVNTVANLPQISLVGGAEAPPFEAASAQIRLLMVSSS